MICPRCEGEGTAFCRSCEGEGEVPCGTVVYDFEGHRLLPGTVVDCAGPGVVTAISDPDGDIDEGRPVAILPGVTVRFPDCEDTFLCLDSTDSWDAYMGAPPVWVCDEILALEHGPER